MPTTINNTLPNDWQQGSNYNKHDNVVCNNIIYDCIEAIQDSQLAPPSDPEHWKALDIYKKDLTVMHHGAYSGDDSFWERDNIYIDTNGWVYIDDQNTGINVNGRITKEISFSDLTPEERESLRGPRGVQGLQGEQGPKGDPGPPGEVTLTPAQINILKGEQGDSAYDVWHKYHEGTEEDFLYWILQNSVVLDTELDRAAATHAVSNQAITIALEDYEARIDTLISQFSERITELENRLKAVYNDQEILFKFGITNEGKYGYYLNNSEDTIIPFDNTGEVYAGTDVHLTEGLALSNLNTSNVTNVMQTFGQTYLENEPTSLDEVTSESSDNNSDYVVASSGVEVSSFEEGFQSVGGITVIYENGNFNQSANTFILYNMTEEENCLQSDEKAIMGFYIPPDIATNDSLPPGKLGSNIYIEWSSTESLDYRGGYYNNTTDIDLGDIVTDNIGTYITGTGESNKINTTVLDLRFESGTFFAIDQRSISSDDRVSFKIHKIYIS